jgi:penicillin amidase
MTGPGPSSSHPRRRLRRLVSAILLVAVLVAAFLAVVVGWGYHVERAALPQTDGTIAVPGLADKVTVVRDRLGVPHITASNLDDLVFAQGYVTAQDRLWQMDVMRRYAAGELAEVLGPSVLPLDKRARILGLRQAAEQSEILLPAEEKARLETYARGVNAFIAASRDRLPLEFRILRYRPRSWKPTDSLLLASYLADMLSGELYAAQVAHENVIAKMGPEAAHWLYDTASPRDHAPGDDAPPADNKQGAPDDSTLLRLPPQVAMAALAQRAVQVIDGPLPGSNNWVVSGAHTASGRPLLSNDMHLPHQLPDIWYIVDLKAGAFHVAGVSAPGAPFVIVGHNDHIAWGDTNLCPEAQDVFVETFNRRGEYLTPNGWQSVQRRTEVIRVKDRPNVTLEVESTRHGPIISSLIPGETRQLALRWTLYDPGSIVLPFYAVDAARDWQEFLAAWRSFTVPAQNIVYADDQGHIGYHAVGHVPLRANPTNMLPVPGAGNQHEWTGYIPFDQLPSAFDPPSGIIATANARITPRGYPFYVTDMWEKPYRTERIYQVLEAGRKLTAADMLKLQTDVYSAFDRFLAERFAAAIGRTPGASPRARQAAGLLRAWNGEMSADEAAPTIVQRSQRELWQLMLGPKLGEGAVFPVGKAGHGKYYWFRANVAMENILRQQPAALLPPGYASYDALLAAAVERAMAREGVPADLAAWKWGTVSTVQVEHPVFGSIPLLRRWTGTPLLPQSGDSNTVKQVGHSFGPSERMTVDFADLDASTLNIVNGQSGNFLSRHYDDQWQAWYSGTTFPWPWTGAAVEKVAAHTLTLEPAGGSQ